MMSSLKERLVTRRNALGWSQETLAAKSGVSPRAIASYEAGSLPAPRLLEKLANALGVTPLWLMGAATPLAPAPAVLRDAPPASNSSTRKYAHESKAALDQLLAEICGHYLERKDSGQRILKLWLHDLIEVAQELELRESRSASGNPPLSPPEILERDTTTRSKLILAASLAEVERERSASAASSPSPTAPSHSDNAAGPSAHSHPRPDLRQTPPKPAPK